LIKFGMNYPQSGECRSQEWFFKHALKELKAGDDIIVSKIREKFDLTEETAKTYLK